MVLAEQQDTMKVGDKVKLEHYGNKHVGEVTKVDGNRRVRVRFLNCSGYYSEVWRPIGRIEKVNPEGGSNDKD